MRQELIDFKELIEERSDYIRSLEHLRNNWVNGESEAPHEEIRNTCIIVLQQIFILYSTKLSEKHRIPKLVMGPIAIGGFSIEFIFSQDTAVYFNLYNNGLSNVEFQEKGYFSIARDSNQLIYLLTRLSVQ